METKNKITINIDSLEKFLKEKNITKINYMLLLPFVVFPTLISFDKSEIDSQIKGKFIEEKSKLFEKEIKKQLEIQTKQEENIDLMDFFTKLKENGIQTMSFVELSDLAYNFLNTKEQIEKKQEDYPSEGIYLALSTVFRIYKEKDIDQIIKSFHSYANRLPFYNETNDSFPFPIERYIDNYELFLKYFPLNIINKILDNYILNYFQKINIIKNNEAIDIETNYIINLFKQVNVTSFTINFDKVLYNIICDQSCINISIILNYLLKRQDSKSENVITHNITDNKSRTYTLSDENKKQILTFMKKENIQKTLIESYDLLTKHQTKSKNLNIKSRKFRKYPKKLTRKFKRY